MLECGTDGGFWSECCRSLIRNRKVPSESSIVLEHNLEPEAFKWLWAKYVLAPNLEKHCTASLKAAPVRRADGRRSVYSQRFSGASNPEMKATPRLVMDEAESFWGIYLCGVAAAGYSQQRNYPHNLHAAILPAPGQSDTFEFERWQLRVENGLFTRIPGEEELSPDLRKLPPAFVTCRIFRWAACILPGILRGADRNRLLLNSRR